MVSRYERRIGGIESSVPQQLESPENFVRSLEQDSLRLANQMTTTAGELFKTDFEIASRQQISDIYAQSPNDPDKLKENFDKALNGLIRGAPMQQSLQLRQSFEALASTHLTKAAENKLRVDTDRLRENSLTIMNQSINDMEHRASDMLSNNQAVAFDASRAMQDSRLQLENELNRVDSQGNPFYSADQRVKMREDTTQNIMSIGLRRWFDQQPDKIEAREQIMNGEKDFKFYDADGNLDLVLNPTLEMRIHDFERLENHMDRAIEQQMKLAKQMEEDNRISLFLNGEAIVDPKNKDDVTAIDRYFEMDVLPKLMGLNPLEQGQAITEFSLKFGLVPSSIRSQIRAAVRNGTPHQMDFTSSIVEGIANHRPELLEDISPDSLSYALAYAKRRQVGMEGKDVKEMLNDVFDPRNKEVIAKRQADFNEIKRNAKINPQADLRQRFHEGWFFWNNTRLPEPLDVQDSIVTRYTSLLEEEYRRTGDLDDARRAALALISTMYGVTNAESKPTIIPHPPEMYYKIEGEGVKNQNWIGKQLRSLVREVDPSIHRDDIFLSPDNLTEIQAASGRPTYPVLIRNRRGELEPITDKEGRLIRFAPNPQERIAVLEKRYEEEKRLDELNKESIRRSLEHLAPLSTKHRDKRLSPGRHLLTDYILSKFPRTDTEDVKAKPDYTESIFDKAARKKIVDAVYKSRREILSKRTRSERSRSVTLKDVTEAEKKQGKIRGQTQFQGLYY